MIIDGLRLKPRWMHCNGETSKTSMTLFSYHPSRSITWLWAVYWHRPTTVFRMPKIVKWGSLSGYGSRSVYLPLVGGFTFSWQPEVLRSHKEQPHD